MDIRVALADKIWAVRVRRLRLTQREAAGLLGSSQTRVAAMEAPAKNVSLDLLIKSALALGVGRNELSAVIAGRDKSLD